jgi:putative oxidoreductase
VSNDLRRGIVANERSSDSRPVPRRIGIWILQGVVACAFFAAGATKLAAAPFEVQLFAQIGLGQWFGGLWLGLTMFCAVVANLAVLHTSPAPAIVLGLLNALIVYLRRDELASIARTLLGRR